MLEGIRRAERLLDIDPHNVRALSLGAVALVNAGDRERALEWCRRAIETGAPGDPSAYINIGCTYLKLGDIDAALDSLENAFGRGCGKRDWVDHDPDYDPVRDHPRFRAMLEKLK